MTSDNNLNDNSSTSSQEVNFELNALLEEKFGIGKEFQTITDAKRAAKEIGNLYNFTIVTARSDLKRMKLILACKHHGEYRAATKKANMDTVEKPYVKSTQRSNCPFEIKFKKSSSGGLIVANSVFGHNHELVKKPVSCIDENTALEEAQNAVLSELRSNIYNTLNDIKNLSSALESQLHLEEVLSDLTDIKEKLL